MLLSILFGVRGEASTAVINITRGHHMTMWLNQPAAGKAGIAPWLTIGQHWPGLPEPGR